MILQDFWSGPQCVAHEDIWSTPNYLANPMWLKTTTTNLHNVITEAMAVDRMPNERL